jgi:hypothetical protein
MCFSLRLSEMALWASGSSHQELVSEVSARANQAIAVGL